MNTIASTCSEHDRHRRRTYSSRTRCDYHDWRQIYIIVHEGDCICKSRPDTNDHDTDIISSANPNPAAAPVSDRTSHLVTRFPRETTDNARPDASVSGLAISSDRLELSEATRPLHQGVYVEVAETEREGPVAWRRRWLWHRKKTYQDRRRWSSQV